MLHALLADNYSFWLPESAARNADMHDWLFYFILWINIFFSTLIMAMMIAFVLMYRHRKGQKHDPTAGHNTTLELTWTIIPTLLVLVIFYFGFRGYLHANTIPMNTTQVTANAQMWSWSFTYPEGFTSNDLHIVVNKPTVMVLQSADVLHDLFVPAFRMKKDAVPGRYNKTWFEPTVEGTYQAYCAMYCGQNHSVMLANCIVESQAKYDKWVNDQLVWEDKKSFIDRGKQLAAMYGCVQCHSVDGTNMAGPTWKDLYGAKVECEGGAVVDADDAYIKESIWEPAAKIVKGYKNVMPADFKAKIKENDIRALTWYMKSVSSSFKGDLTEGKTVGAAMKYTQGAAGAPASQPASAPSSAPAAGAASDGK